MEIVSEALTTLNLRLTSYEADQVVSKRYIRDNRNGKYYELVLPIRNDNGNITATFRYCDPPQTFEIVGPRTELVNKSLVEKIISDSINNPNSTVSLSIQKNFDSGRRRI